MGARLGTVWRITYPSRFGRDALCCDIFTSRDGQESYRIRLINVHLDSLPIQPSRRPQQISIAASLLNSAGRGIVAGDFNPVLPEDETLVTESGLHDAWLSTNDSEPGFTWGISGKESFPPARLDKIAMVGLLTQEVTLMHPVTIANPATASQCLDQTAGKDQKGHGEARLLPWSDHSGLRCLFKPI